MFWRQGGDLEKKTDCCWSEWSLESLICVGTNHWNTHETKVEHSPHSNLVNEFSLENLMRNTWREEWRNSYCGSLYLKKN